MNLKTIADGVAARFVAVTATNGSATETATATADLPNAVAKLALLVYPPTGELSIIMGPHTNDHYDFPVKLLRDPLSVPERSQWLYAWATALRPLVQAKFSLGVTGVVEAQASGLRMEIDGEKYSMPDGVYREFDVVEFTVRVHVYEIAAGVSL